MVLVAIMLLLVVISAEKRPSSLHLANGETVTVWEEPGSSEVGKRVWGGAKLLSEFLQKNRDIRGIRVLELGSGTGLLGLAAASLGGHVTMTDHHRKKDVLENPVLNALTQSPRGRGSRRPKVCRVRPLTWGRQSHLQRLLQQGGKPDMILGTGVIYNTQSLPALVTTLTALSARHTECLVAYHKKDAWAGRKSAWAHFVKLAEKDGWRTEDNVFTQPGSDFTVLRLLRAA